MSGETDVGQISFWVKLSVTAAVAFFALSMIKVIIKDNVILLFSFRSKCGASSAVGVYFS